jgi:uncharacterized membrane protein
MTQDIVKSMLGDLYTAKIAKTAGIIILIVLGALLVGLGIFFVVKAKKILRAENLGIIDSNDYKKMVNGSSTYD